MLKARCSIALLLIALAGCGNSDLQAQDLRKPSYQRPTNWSSTCFGRFSVDVPGRLEFGSANQAFRSGDRDSLYEGEMGPPFLGEVSVASNHLRESAVLQSKEDFGYAWKQADDYYRIEIVRDGGPASERALRGRGAQRLSLQNRGFVWRYKTQFDFGTFLEADMRSRMLHGQLSGEGSIAQAKAVVETLWPRYRPRKSGEMPSDAGICTPYGFLADPTGATERDYALAFQFPDARHSNVILQLEVRTHSQATTPYGTRFTTTPIDQWPTPWAVDEQQAALSKAECRPQQGTASRDLFGCMFAGARSIKRHREVEYLTVANGQRARLLVMELYPAINDYYEYEVRVESQGVPNSATRPDIRLSVYGIGRQTSIPSMRGRHPPSIDEAVSTARTIAASLRLRPGAVDEKAVVKDTLEGVR
ncbi:MAG: hypothetical protein KF891_15550 [Rhizobacter sp.]|nr:hypothetical protein [Rhizobacter sp.]